MGEVMKESEYRKLKTKSVKKTINGITLSNSSWRILEQLSYHDVRLGREENEN